ncbi:M61 family metallopeptidase [Shewanella gaetbuli]|uniref:PDZ domain-containing protein n=1 Tax=Shewanella gaetbuli TaxID=220752 RepID=A0A9X2CKG1_9GAMM|nr:PDZ domain-containing protein [Shewanella gaetbuli]
MKPSTLALVVCCAFISNAAIADVEYHIDLTEPEHHLAQVSVTFPSTSKNSLVINLPVWRTGRYEVLPVADGVRLFEATDRKGNSLDWQRTASGEWQINLPKPTEVTINYQVYANQLGDRLRHIDRSHAFLDASGIFMYSPEFRDENVTVNMSVPKRWQSYSGMKRGNKKHSFIAENYDVLVDSPIETGISQHFTFEADNRDYEVVFWGEGNYDTQQIVTDLEKISYQAKAIWDGYPFERYVYMIHATSGARGATEHLNSTVIQLPRFNFRERKDYLRFISTASHEFIHTWNVKAYRPQGLVPYDYQAENMSELLWVAEGSTSYFQNQLLLRAGVISAKEFFEDLSKRINNNLHKPGREIQSIKEASLGQWSSTRGDYSLNHSVNIYAEGYMTSLALDFSLLDETRLAHSYRDVHNKLYQDFKVPRGYSVQDIKDILFELSGKDYQPWWQANVTSALSIDFEALLAKAGLTIGYSNPSATKVDAGLTVSTAGDHLTVTHVVRNGVAWQAGVNAGDIIVAVNGLRVSASDWLKRLADFKPGNTIKVSLFNNDKLVTREITLAEQPKGELKILPLSQVSNQQKSFLKAWIGIDWPFDNNGHYLKAKQ